MPYKSDAEELGEIFHPAIRNINAFNAEPNRHNFSNCQRLYTFNMSHNKFSNYLDFLIIVILLLQLLSLPRKVDIRRIFITPVVSFTSTTFPSNFLRIVYPSVYLPYEAAWTPRESHDVVFVDHTTMDNK